MTEIITEEVRRILDEGPPIAWYLGYGTKRRGILYITYSKKLESLAGGEVGKHFGSWRHYTSNPAAEGDLEGKARADRVMQEAEAFVEKATGFSPSEIAAKSSVLSKLFEGQRSVPFDFNLY